MTTGLRRILLAGAGLLAISAILFFRLNSADLSDHFYGQLGSATDAVLTANHSELAFIHGIGLRLDGVSLVHKQYEMQAGHLNISLGLLPLLLGKIEVNTLDIHDATITIHPESLQLTSTAISSLPVNRIHLIRSRILTPDGTELLNNLQMELRDIGPNRETLWELSAQQGKQSISGNGRLLFRAGKIAGGFGNLKLNQLRLSGLKPFVPETLIAWLENKGKFISGALTLDIPRQQIWSVFGSVDLKNNNGKTTLNLRGKLSHPSKGKLAWHDSFMSFGKHAVLAIKGGCEKNSCNTSVDAEQVPLFEWFSFLPENLTFQRNISGMTKLKADIEWDKKAWHGHATLQLKEAAFHDGEDNILLPDLQILAGELSGSAQNWYVKATISTTQGSDSNAINIRSSLSANGNKDMFINTDAADAPLWQPLSNLLLASLDMNPTLKATGQISGKLHLHQQISGKSLEIDLDATQAQIGYAPWFEKPQHVTALCQMKIGFSENSPTTVSMQHCQLDKSSLAQLKWSVNKEQHKLTIDQLKLNLDQLRNLSVQLPEHTPRLKGLLQGSGHTSWTDHDSDWFGHMSGHWQLQNLGTESWLANGVVDVKHGIVSSSQLQVSGPLGNAELKGSYEVSKQRGDVDIIAGNLDWKTATFPGSFWKKVSLNGNIQHVGLTLMGSHWYEIQSDYNLAEGKLKLNELQSILADGSFTSKQLILFPAASHEPTTEGLATDANNGLGIQGYIRAENVQLHKLRRLGEWFQADISGKLHANIKLNGDISQTSFAAWQYSNGDILIYNGSWKQQMEAESLTERLGIKTPLFNAYAFSKLGFRFHIDKDRVNISNIKLVRHHQQYRGKAGITPGLHLQGHIFNSTDATGYLIDSTLPAIHWQLQQKPVTPPPATKLIREP